MKGEKPVGRIRRFARLLGWAAPLRLFQHQDEDGSRPLVAGGVITWYEAGEATGGRNDCFLQINESPQGQAVAYQAAVFAVRYRIVTGWHAFRLFDENERLQREAARLAPWLGWDQFATPAARRAFRQAHPECANRSWRTLRDDES